MKERGILYSAQMAREMVARRKRQTRRLLYVLQHGRRPSYTWDRRYQPPPLTDEMRIGSCWTLSQWAKALPGDITWGRESWRTGAAWDTDPPRSIAHGSSVSYEASEPGRMSGKLRPGIFMPRWASRIVRRLEAVRVERLQSITGADAKLEGAPKDACYGPHCPAGSDGCNARGCYGAREWYQELWDTLHDAPGTRWADDPWVVVLTFEQP